MANNQNQNNTQAADNEKELLLKQIEELQKTAADAEKRAEDAEKNAADAAAKISELQSAAAKHEETPSAAEERVEIFIPKGSANDEPNYFIAVNGVNYLLPKGKKSLVPKHVAAEYERAVKAQHIQDQNVDALRSKE